MQIQVTSQYTQEESHVMHAKLPTKSPAQKQQRRAMAPTKKIMYFPYFFVYIYNLYLFMET